MVQELILLSPIDIQLVVIIVGDLSVNIAILNPNYVTIKAIASSTFEYLNLKNHKMKRIVFFVIVAIFSLSATTVFASKSDKESKVARTAVTAEAENKLSDEEVERITNRVEVIRNMDKSELTASEKSELKRELKEMKENVKKANGTIYIGGATLVLIIILVLLLL